MTWYTLLNLGDNPLPPGNKGHDYHSARQEWVKNIVPLLTSYYDLRSESSSLRSHLSSVKSSDNCIVIKEGMRMYNTAYNNTRHIVCVPLPPLLIKRLIYSSILKNVVLESKGPSGDFLIA